MIIGAFFIDLTWLWNSLSSQLYIALAIVGAVAMLIGAVTQNVWAGVGVFFGVLAIAVCIAGLSNLDAIGNFLWENVFKGVPAVIIYHVDKGMMFIARLRI